MATILVVEDEAPVQAVLCRSLTAGGHSAVGVPSGEEALRSARTRRPDLAVLDLKLPGIDGVETFHALRIEHPDLKAVVLTGFGTIPSAVMAIRAGIFDYLEKPVDLNRLARVVDACLGTGQNAVAATELGAMQRRLGEFEGMIGTCPAMLEVFRLIPKVAASAHPVLVEGETGTGKELVARAVHRHSPRRNGPFVDINCAAGQVTLFESEFFGHERGAFTDAREAKPGRFEQAHGGTLFLDEIGELPLEAQAKLLRVIERGETTRVGGTKVIHFDVRIIAATNVDLEQAVARGTLRRDLFYRVNALTVRLPPLRERGGDVSLILDHVFGLIAQQRVPTATLSSEARAILAAYEWPGNVRELEHVLVQAVLTGTGSTIRTQNLPARVFVRSLGVRESDFLLPPGVTLAQHIDRVTARIERALIRQALLETRDNRADAAKRLGVDRRTLFRKLRRAT